jgi:hypothetical protein
VSVEIANNPSPVPSAAATCSSTSTGDVRHATSRM